MLIQLPNGDWVAPEAVTAVLTDWSDWDFGPDNKVYYPVKVIWGNVVSWCKAESREASVELRDQIAEQINKALYKPEGTP